LKNVFGGLRVRQIGFAVLATALLAASLTLAFATGARAADPPPPPPPTTTLPSPDPAPPVTPKPPPPPKPIPHHTSPPSAPPPVTPPSPPVVSTHPTVHHVSPPAPHHVKPKPHKKKALPPKEVPAPVTPPPSLEHINVGSHTAAVTAPGGDSLRRALVISGIGLAALLFLIVLAVPVTAARFTLPGRVVIDHQTDLVLAGVASLLLTALLFAITGGG
jgi:hypothetical protein